MCRKCSGISHSLPTALIVGSNHRLHLEGEIKELLDKVQRASVHKVDAVVRLLPIACSECDVKSRPI